MDLETLSNYDELKQQLKTELALARYNGTTAEQAATMLNNFSSGDIFTDRTVVPSWEIIGAVDPAEWTSRFGAWTEAQKAYFANLVAGGTVNAASANVKTVLGGVGGLFPNASAPTTRAALLALVNRQCSRAEKLFGSGVVVRPWDVQRARDLP